MLHNQRVMALKWMHGAKRATDSSVKPHGKQTAILCIKTEASRSSGAREYRLGLHALSCLRCNRTNHEDQFMSGRPVDLRRAQENANSGYRRLTNLDSMLHTSMKHRYFKDMFFLRHCRSDLVR